MGQGRDGKPRTVIKAQLSLNSPGHSQRDGDRIPQAKVGKRVRLAKHPYREFVGPILSTANQVKEVTKLLAGLMGETTVPLPPARGSRSFLPLGVQHCQKPGRALSRVQKIGVKGTAVTRCSTAG